jgi:hypothetical protein
LILLGAIRTKEGPDNFNFGCVDAPNTGLGVLYNIDDKSIKQPSKLLIARNAAKEAGTKYSAHDDYLHKLYDPEDDFYEEDEFGIRRYNREKAYAKKNTKPKPPPGVRAKFASIKPKIPQLHRREDLEDDSFLDQDLEEVEMGGGGGGGVGSKKKLTRDE